MTNTKIKGSERVRGLMQTELERAKTHNGLEEAFGQLTEVCREKGLTIWRVEYAMRKCAVFFTGLSLVLVAKNCSAEQLCCMRDFIMDYRRDEKPKGEKRGKT